MIDLCQQCHEPLDEDREGCLTGLCEECSATRCQECEEDLSCCTCDPDEPEDEDLVTKDYETFYRAGMSGRVAFTVPHGEEWQDAAKRYMEKTQYWPSVWLEEERGGYTNITVEGP